MHKKKISLVLDNEFVLRSYLESSTISKLRLEFEVELVLINQETNHLLNNFYTISKHKYLQFLQTIFSVSYWIKKRKVSNSFRIRLLSLLHSRRYFYSSRKPSFRLPSIPVLVGFIVGYARFKIPSIFMSALSMNIEKHFRTTKTNLIIYVTSGGASSNSDVLSLIGSKLKIPTLVVIENWDNLTSKAVFNFKPDFLGVWGKQDLEASISLHGFSPENVVEIGSPRISKLIRNHKKESTSSKKILFAGGSTDFPFELEWLKYTFSLAHKFERSFIYVPHPANYSSIRKYLNGETDQIFSSIPTQILQLIKSKDGKSLPDLDFYTPIFHEAWVTISPYSTMLLESLLLGIPTVGVDFNDFVKGSEEWASQAFEHFHNLETFVSYFRVTQFIELEQTLGRLAEISVRKTPEFLIGERSLYSKSIFYDTSELFDDKLSFVAKEILSVND